MKLVETQLSARLRLGGRGDVIGELEAAVATYPYQEGLWELLITALYRAGRQADALADYQRVRDAAGRRARPRARARGCSSSSSRSSTTTAPLRGPDRARAPGTCRRCRPSSSAARRRSPRSSDLLAQRAARRDRRAGRYRQDGGRDRDRPHAVRGARRRLAGPARDRDDGRRRPRHGDRRAERHRRRGGAARAAQGRRRGGDPRQLRARRRRRRRARGPPPRRRARRCGSCAPARSPLDVDGEAVFELAPLALADAVELFTRRADRAARRQPSARPTTRCASCAARSTACRWRSSSPRRAPGRCRSRRSPAASTIASAC